MCFTTHTAPYYLSENELTLIIRLVTINKKGLSAGIIRVGIHRLDELIYTYV